MYLMAIDQGTSSTRAMILDKEGKVLGASQREIQLYYPHDGWVEEEGEELWEKTLFVMKEALNQSRIDPQLLKGIGITNQRETTLLWDAESGRCVARAIVWQDRRTQDFCLSLKEKSLEKLIQSKTGLLIDPYFSASKIHWIIENNPEAKSLLGKGTLRFGTVDTFLLWRLTKGNSHKTDVTNASRTLLFNIHTLRWDEELLAIFNIPHGILPTVEENISDFGITEKNFLGVEVPIVALMGDQQAAAFGQGCFEKGMMKATYGTGCFMLLNTGEEALTSENRLLTTIAYQYQGRVSYALEGSIFVAGAAVQWLRDAMKFIQEAKDSERIAMEVEDTGGVYLVPAFTGLGAPYWDPSARGAILGLTRNTGINHIVRAALEAVCYQSQDLLLAMEKDGAKIKELRVDGGMAANDWFLQFLSNIIQKKVIRPHNVESTTLGIASLAGLALGFYPNLDAISALWKKEKEFTSAMSLEKQRVLYEGWKEAVGRLCS